MWRQWALSSGVPEKTPVCSPGIHDDGKQRFFAGTAAVIFFIAHAATWLLRGAPANLLWACHLGCLLVGIAILAGRPALNAVGVLWLVLGNILWCINLAGGGEFIFTSQLTHLGGLLIGLWYARRAGFPRGSWLKALAGIAALHLLSGFVTPARENINLAFRVFRAGKKSSPTSRSTASSCSLPRPPCFFRWNLLSVAKKKLGENEMKNAVFSITANWKAKNSRP